MLALLLLANTAVADIRPIDDELYSETYSWMADLDDGTYVLAQMLVTNIGPGDRNAACRYIVASSSGSTSDGKSYDEGEWSKILNGFRVGKCRLSADANGARMHIEVNDATIDLTTSTPFVARRPPSGQVQVPSGRYGVEVLATHHDVTVALKLDGKPRSAKGRGFINHSRATALPGKVARRWVRFRAVRGDEPWVVHARLPADGSAATGFTITDDETKTVSFARVGSRGTGAKRAYRAQIETEAGRLSITTTGEPLFRDAPFEKYGWLGKLLGSLLGNPVTFTYRAKLEVDRRTIEGVVEIALID